MTDTKRRPADDVRSLPDILRARFARFRAWRYNTWLMIGLSLLMVAATAEYFRRQEGEGAALITTSAVSIALLTGLISLTRRFLVSSLLIGAMIAFVAGVSLYKRSLEKMAMHAYDFYFFFPTPKLLLSLWSNHRLFLVVVLSCILATAVLAIVAWHVEKPRVRRIYPVLAFALFTFLSFFAAQEKVERRNTQFYWDDMFLASFFSSVAETFEAVARGQLLEAATSSSARPALVGGAACTPASKPPHIILIHQDFLEIG